MALCRRCGVREEDFWGSDGLCAQCHEEKVEEEKRREREDWERKVAEERRQAEWQEEFDAEEEHRERIEELQRQAAEDSAKAARDSARALKEAAEAKRIAGLKTFTCFRCEATFNEEQGLSAVKSPIGKPLCNDCLQSYAQCCCCHKFFWGDKNPIKTFSYEYVDGAHVERKKSSKKMCFGCQNTKGREYIIRQKKLAEKFDSQNKR